MEAFKSPSPLQRPPQTKQTGPWGLENCRGEGGTETKKDQRPGGSPLPASQLGSWPRLQLGTHEPMGEELLAIGGQLGVSGHLSLTRVG